jgi:hypothetical protein
MDNTEKEKRKEEEWMDGKIGKRYCSTPYGLVSKRANRADKQKLASRKRDLKPFYEMANSHPNNEGIPGSALTRSC